jgi:hypothetical protein
MRRCYIGILLAIQTAIIVFGFKNPDIRALLKQDVWHSDTLFFNGFFRRVYHGQRIPDLSQHIAAHSTSDYEWSENKDFLAIGHGLGPQMYGGIDTLKTLEKGWERGFRLFEVDLSVTSDNYLICYHGGEEREIDNTSYADYLNIMRKEKHPPCHFSDIVRYARQHPETRFILDVKNRFYDAYAMVRHEIGDRSLGKSFIPQVYNFEQLPAIRQNNFFAGEIFTSYRSALTNRQIFNAARKCDVRVVTLTTDRFFDQKGKFPEKISILIHPVNDPFIAATIRKQGGSGIYTSYLTPLSVPELFVSDAPSDLMKYP